MRSTFMSRPSYSAIGNDFECNINHQAHAMCSNLGKKALRAVYFTWIWIQVVPLVWLADYA